jgi:hypothetical protein
MAYTQKNNPFKKVSNGDSNNQNTDIAKTVTDFVTPQNTLELGLSALGGVAVGKFGTKFLKTKAGQKLISKFPSLKNLTKPISQSTKKAEFNFKPKESKFNFTGKKDIHMGKGPEVVQRQLNEMKSIGGNLDEISFDATKLTSKDVKFRGSVSGRSIVEVNTPSGTQLFYKSSGLAGKKGGGTGGTTEGMWQPYGGHADVAGRKGWFIKDEGYENFYNSKSLRDISGNLDRLSVEGGFQQHITKAQAHASKIK